MKVLTSMVIISLY